MRNNNRSTNEDILRNLSIIDRELIKRLGISNNRLIELHNKCIGLRSDINDSLMQIENKKEFMKEKYGVHDEDKRLKTSDPKKLLEMVKVQVITTEMMRYLKYLTNYLSQSILDWQKDIHCDTRSFNTPRRAISDCSRKGHPVAIKKHEDRAYFNAKRIWNELEKSINGLSGSIRTLFQSNIIPSESKEDISNFLSVIEENKSRIDLAFNELKKSSDSMNSCKNNIRNIQAKIKERDVIDIEEAGKLGFYLYNEQNVGRGYKL